MFLSRYGRAGFWGRRFDWYLVLFFLVGGLGRVVIFVVLVFLLVGGGRDGDRYFVRIEGDFL